MAVQIRLGAFLYVSTVISKYDDAEYECGNSRGNWEHCQSVIVYLILNIEMLCNTVLADFCLQNPLGMPLRNIEGIQIPLRIPLRALKGSKSL